jgi:GGDEF domain-containing protein
MLSSKLAETTRCDGLTGLPNLTTFTERSVARIDRETFAVIAPHTGLQPA